jgi:CheY-like chemotaxis protein
MKLVAEQRRTVLIVEDEADLRDLIVEFLIDDYSPVMAKSADQGIDMAWRTRPAIIICDLHMPGKNGLHTIREVRRDPTLAHVPIILMSGQGEPPECAQFNVTFLPKPFGMPKLMEAIESAFATAVQN